MGLTPKMGAARTKTPNMPVSVTPEAACTPSQHAESAKQTQNQPVSGRIVVVLKLV